MPRPAAPGTRRRAPAARGSGAVTGTLGGLIGLGGTELRLPPLIGAFRLAALAAAIPNKAMSLAVASALPFQAGTVPLGAVVAHGPMMPACSRAACSALGSG